MNATHTGCWWRRIGGIGQVTIITALLGLLAATIPVVVSVVRPGFGGHGGATRDAVIGGDPRAAPTPTVPATTPPAQTPTRAAPIRFTVHDQLTEGVVEETIVVTLEGVRVATLTASRGRPTVSQRVTASRAANDAYGNGAELDVHLHFEGNGVSLPVGTR
jgi:hypothetical protein